MKSSRTSGTSAISSKNSNMWPLWWRCTVQATKAWWLGDVQASVAKCTWPECSCSQNVSFGKYNWCSYTWRSLSTCWRHMSNALLISRAMVLGEGSVELGWPAFMSITNSWSLTILKGQLFSTHHLAMWALKECWEKNQAKEKKKSLSFFTSKWTVGYHNGLLTWASKGSKDGPITRASFCLISHSINNIKPKTLDSMCPQVGCSCTVFGVKISPDDTTSFAFLGRASEKVELAVFFMSNFNIWFKKSINWWVPHCLEAGCIVGNCKQCG